MSRRPVVLVTGGARRIGAATVRRLHAAGCNVAIHFNNSSSEALSLHAELNKIRENSSICVKADLHNIDGFDVMMGKVVKHFGRLDALVNNASSFFPTSLEKLSEKDWIDLIGINLRAPLFLAQAAAPFLLKTNGCIVNIVDIHAELPMPGHLMYNVAKAGLAGLTRALATELAPHVRVNGVAPGPILWPESNEWEDVDRHRKIIERTLLKRIGEPDDIAKTVQFLILDAPYITGQIITVDGGRSINP